MMYAEAEIGIDYLLYSLQIIIGEILVFVKLFSESENTILKSTDGSRTDVGATGLDIAYLNPPYATAALTVKL